MAIASTPQHLRPPQMHPLPIPLSPLLPTIQLINQLQLPNLPLASSHLIDPFARNETQKQQHDIFMKRAKLFLCMTTTCPLYSLFYFCILFYFILLYFISNYFISLCFTGFFFIRKRSTFLRTLDGRNAFILIHNL